MTDKGPPAPPSSYDAIPYRSRAVALTHPDHLAAVGAIHGLDPAPPETCRVLELGCASGVNLLAMAAALPAATFVGIDGSARQIEEGERLRRAAALENVRLIPGRFESLAGDLGEFDYVLCHGVFSWIPPEVQDRVLAICRERLAPGGLAFVSFNVYPGWHSRQMLREMMLFHVRAIAEPIERIRQSRALLELLARLAVEERGTYRARFATMAEDLANTDDGYLFHEFLEEENAPSYFHEVAARASAAGLRYIWSARSTWEAFPPRGVEEALAPLQNRVVREQYMDFLSDRTFRRSVFCRDDAGSAEDAEPSGRIRDLYVEGRARADPAASDPSSDAAVDIVAGPNVRITTASPFVKSVFAALQAASPRALSFDRLLGEAARSWGPAGDGLSEELGALLLRSFAAGLVRLSPTGSRCAWPAPEKPLATSFARVQAAEPGAVTTLSHMSTELSDGDRFVLRLCDGSRNRSDLARELASAVAAGELRIAAADGTAVTDGERIAEASNVETDAAVLRLASLGMFVAPRTDG